MSPFPQICQCHDVDGDGDDDDDINNDYDDQDDNDEDYLMALQGGAWRKMKHNNATNNILQSGH